MWPNIIIYVYKVWSPGKINHWQFIRISEEPGQGTIEGDTNSPHTKEKILVHNIYFGRIHTSDSVDHIGFGHTLMLLGKWIDRSIFIVRKALIMADVSMMLWKVFKS